MKVRYHPEARAELVAAVLWYAQRRPVLGEDFHAEVRRAEIVIARQPAPRPRARRKATAFSGAISF